MRALWDRYPELPYTAHVPWPQVFNPNTQCIDWIESVDLIETWLSNSVGPHWVEWAWSMYTLDEANCCGVSFRYDRNRTLFLLTWS